MKNTERLDRRSFLKSSALAGGGLMLSFSWFTKAEASTNITAGVSEKWHELTGYIKITPDNIIKILCPNPEFGQNVMTSLPMIVAEELDVDWKNVVVEMGPHDNVKLGPQFTGGSNSVRMYWKPLRTAGASARQMLIEAAAQTWGVPANEINTKAGVLSHKNGKSAKYGEMAEKAANIPVPKDIKTKAVKDFSIISKSKKNAEGIKIVTGKPLFGIDYQVDGMLIAMIQHPPAFGMKLKSFDGSQALKLPGIKDVFSFKLYEDGFEQGGFDTRTFNEMIAVVGNSTWEVMNARKKLKAQWEPAGDIKDTMMGRGGKREVTVPGRLETTANQFEMMAEFAKKPSQQLRKDGDPESAFKNAAKIIERTYNAPFLAHNTMEPMNFFAHVQEDKALVAGPLQAPGWTEPTLAKILNLPADKIEIQMTRMGGGFGRRAYGQYVFEAARISQKVKAPVKLIYTREDDMTYGIYRPMYTATYRAALDGNNNLIGFHVIGGGMPESPIHANRFPAGAVDNYLAESWEIPTNITIGAFRAPRSNFNAAAEQSFLDEVAEAMGKDPIDFRLELLKRAKTNPVGKNNEYDADRYAGVLELVKEKSGWGKAENNKYNRGVAAYFCHNSYAAHVVDMVTRDGEPYVEKVTSAMDCGIVINPDAAANMVQGAVVDGIGNAFYGEMTFKDGVPAHNNLNTYRIIKHNEAPRKIDVHFVQNEIDPTGLGEPPFPPVFGAVANALYKNTGKRYYNQPFTAEQPAI
ncbi:MAG: xanthine dehydrogenase family protein molybdopterin-binding subunit [Cytophagaceae bacterium]|nr:xanthine dehydrogenase family protein molybdopterin-binding subunit [Cytophagaceae bacterium]MBK9935984.1 xanthine dehydrogenase family protein molybdopterin-binding subunit [Cytophagaceae bacterium]MBL0304132.1 xanthine dehydrogenase family protein molybdopterin-binding subunit [Cytophagaceae bacterium]MBL0326941.1 xanthine dehydrogenase family protein molybdopterin-binding subunit [Cytophagaceae bacterium]